MHLLVLNDERAIHMTKETLTLKEPPCNGHRTWYSTDNQIGNRTGATYCRYKQGKVKDTGLSRQHLIADIISILGKQPLYVDELCRLVPDIYEALVKRLGNHSDPHLIATEIYALGRMDGIHVERERMKKCLKK